MFSITTVDMSTRMPMASARPPSVMMLTVWPVSHSATTAPINASGMFRTTTNALRQSRQQRAQRTLHRQSRDGARDVRRLVEFVAHLHVARHDALEFGQVCLDAI